jgi:hypothetical protein
VIGDPASEQDAGKAKGHRTLRQEPGKRQSFGVSLDAFLLHCVALSHSGFPPTNR